MYNNNLLAAIKVYKIKYYYFKKCKNEIFVFLDYNSLFHLSICKV